MKFKKHQSLDKEIYSKKSINMNKSSVSFIEEIKFSSSKLCEF